MSKIDQIKAHAHHHGIDIVGEIKFNDMGLDFQVAFAKDKQGQEWVLRLPRRADVMHRAAYERRVLAFLKPRLPIAIPDWQVFSNDLIAYPLLPGQPALTFDSTTYAVTWYMDQHAPAYPAKLAHILSILHKIPPSKAQDEGIEYLAPKAYREDTANKLERVRRELGIHAALDQRLQAWLKNDALWPNHSVFTHGDLYAGHILVDENAHPTAVIDWTEARYSDPAIDFVGHLNVFGMESLKALLKEYEDLSGQMWPCMVEHITERAAAAPVFYGIYALNTQDPNHIQAAGAQLNANL